MRSRRWKTSSKGFRNAALSARWAAINSLAGADVKFDLSIRDRAFALRLVRETTVWRVRLDRALARFSSRPLDSLDRIVLAALRAGAAQLIILGTPPHAAVSATVSVLSGHRASGFVNAVLRRLATEGEPDITGAPVHEKWSHPESLTAKWVSRFGMDKAEKLLEWNNSVPDIGGCIADADKKLRKGLYLDDYRFIERTGMNPVLSEDRKIYIQDEAAAVIARAAADLADGGSVIEIGAAPGGKTHHLQAKANYVVSLDSSYSRMLRWIENRSRLQWRECIPVVSDARDRLFREDFDLVFIDAPCTNTGVYRRRCDARWKWSEQYLENSVSLQKQLLRTVCKLVKPGGILIYSTCSLEEEENQLQVKSFEREVDSFHRMELPGPGELVRDGMICIFPPDDGIDGLFAAAWRRDQ